jgi:hypothetical protein
VGVFSRIIDWFWQRSAEGALRAAGVPGPRVLDLGARATLAAEAATRTLRPAEPFAESGSQALACELYREAIHWALLAHDARSQSATPAESPTPADAASAAASGDLKSLLERVDGDLLRRAAGGDPELAELRTRLAEASYVEFAELAPGEQKKLAQRLEAFCRSLLEPLSAVRIRLERIWVRRCIHVLVVAGVIGAVAWGLHARSVSQERKADLARSAPWKTSSIHPVGGCKSPEQYCSGGENYFFHTAEQDDPWVIFDLGKERRFSGVEIENRLDCCFEKAQLMVVEVSSDQKKWKEVARSKQEFMTFRRHFPSVMARYVRIRVPYPKSILHLSAVRIFR